MHGIYLHDTFPYSVHFPVSVCFAFVSLCDLSVYDSFSVMSSCSPCPYVSTLIPVSVCATLVFLTRIYKPHMSCMSSQFVYQLQLDYYCHSPSACDLSLPPHSILASGNCSTLATLLFGFTHYRKPSRLILQPCNFPVTCGMRIYPPVFEIPGPRQKAGAAHKLMPLSIPPVTSRNL